jgi:glutathione S-transferase
MKLYANPVAAFSRPIVLFLERGEIPVDIVNVDVFGGECKGEEFARRNPSNQIPVLEDDALVLTECSAILKYLADKAGSPAYPEDLKQRAKVNEAMDWFNTGFVRDYSYGFVYPQILPDHKRPTDAANKSAVEWGRDKARRWMEILDSKWLGDGRTYLCGDEITIADYFAAGPIHVGELIGIDFSAYPNVARWLANMKTQPGWKSVDYEANGLVEAMKGPDYVTLA